jgi:Abnormal spindle-like microcephaly-assoc'd, ASPM-SPD-2-Hydin
MIRYCPGVLLVVASLLVGCGGGTTALTTPSAGDGGAAAGQLSASSPNIAFGNVTVGSSSTQTRKVTAGTSAVTITSGSWSGDGFSLSGITFPVTLKAGQSAPFAVTFAPQVSGVASGGVSFLSNASNSPTTETFTGSGSQPSAHSVSLFWSPSPSSVVGYNVYRGTTSGGPYPSQLTPSPLQTNPG